MARRLWGRWLLLLPLGKLTGLVQPFVMASATPTHGGKHGAELYRTQAVAGGKRGKKKKNPNSPGGGKSSGRGGVSAAELDGVPRRQCGMNAAARLHPMLTDAAT